MKLPSDVVWLLAWSCSLSALSSAANLARDGHLTARLFRLTDLLFSN